MSESTTIDTIGEMFDTATIALDHMLTEAVHTVAEIADHHTESTLIDVDSTEIASVQPTVEDASWHEQALNQLIQQHNVEPQATADVVEPQATASSVQVAHPTAHQSKKEIAAQIYVDMIQRQCPRKDIIGAMMKQADLTFNGASTYYQQFKSGVANLANVKPRVERPKYETMSIDDLLQFYNEHATVKLHGFLCHEDGVKMIDAYVING